MGVSSAIIRILMCKMEGKNGQSTIISRQQELYGQGYVNVTPLSLDVSSVVSVGLTKAVHGHKPNCIYSTKAHLNASGYPVSSALMSKLYIRIHCFKQRVIYCHMTTRCCISLILIDF